MIKEIQGVICDPSKDVLMHSQDLEERYRDYYCSKIAQICYVHLYEVAGDCSFMNEKIEELTMDKFNSELEFFDAPSRIFTSKKEMRDWMKKKDAKVEPKRKSVKNIIKQIEKDNK